MFTGWVFLQSFVSWIQQQSGEAMKNDFQLALRRCWQVTSHHLQYKGKCQPQVRILFNGGQSISTSSSIQVYSQQDLRENRISQVQSHRGILSIQWWWSPKKWINSILVTSKPWMMSCLTGVYKIARTLRILPQEWQTQVMVPSLRRGITGYAPTIKGLPHSSAYWVKFTAV